MMYRLKGEIPKYTRNINNFDFYAKREGFDIKDPLLEEKVISRIYGYKEPFDSTYMIDEIFDKYKDKSFEEQRKGLIEDCFKPAFDLSYLYFIDFCQYGYTYEELAESFLKNNDIKFNFYFGRKQPIPDWFKIKIPYQTSCYEITLQIHCNPFLFDVFKKSVAIERNLGQPVTFWHSSGFPFFAYRIKPVNGFISWSSIEDLAEGRILPEHLRTIHIDMMLDDQISRPLVAYAFAYKFWADLKVELKGGECFVRATPKEVNDIIYNMDRYAEILLKN